LRFTEGEGKFEIRNQKFELSGAGRALFGFFTTSLARSAIDPFEFLISNFEFSLSSFLPQEP